MTLRRMLRRNGMVFFNKLAEIVGQHLKKGAKIYVEGRLQTRKWTGADGVDRYTTEIVGNEMLMLDRRDPNAASYSQNAPGAAQRPAAAEQPAAMSGGSATVTDNSMPAGEKPMAQTAQAASAPEGALLAGDEDDIPF